MKFELIYGYFSSLHGRFKMRNEELHLSSNVKVNLERDPYSGVPIFIEIIEQPNKYMDLYGEKIVSINAIIGENSTGKTTIIQTLGLQPYTSERLILQEEYFWITRFRYNNKHYYIIEGNGLQLIESIIKRNTGYENKKFPNLYSFICEYDSEYHSFQEVSINKSILRDIRIVYDFDLSGRCYEWNEPDYHALFNLRSDNCINRYYCHYNYHSIANYLMYMEKTSEELKSPYLRIDNIQMVIDTESYPIIERNYHDKGRIVYDEFINKIEHHKESQKNIYSDTSLIEHCWNELKKCLDQIKKDFFVKDVSRTMLLISAQDFDDNVIEMLKAIDDYNECVDVNKKLKCTFSGMSSGQEKVVDIMAGIYSTLETQTHSMHSIVLLDEPEKGFHPEMARNLIDMLVRATNGFKGTFQFILTTHSPFVISDIPCSNIHCLEVDKNECDTIHITRTQKGLLSNIPDILHDTFFLRSPFGEFANNFFSFLCDSINDLSSESKNNNDTQQDVLEDIPYDINYNRGNITQKALWLKSIIDDISEPTIYSYLNNCLMKKIETFKNEESLDYKISYHEAQANYYKLLRDKKSND